MSEGHLPFATSPVAATLRHWRNLTAIPDNRLSLVGAPDSRSASVCADERMEHRQGTGLAYAVSSGGRRPA